MTNDIKARQGSAIRGDSSAAVGMTNDIVMLSEVETSPINESGATKTASFLSVRPSFYTCSRYSH